MNKTHFVYMPIKKHWQDLIESGKKDEEYRTMSKRNMTIFDKVNRIIASSTDQVVIRFHQYHGVYLNAVVKSVRIGRGNPDLGAPKDEDVIIYKIEKI